ncbi:hypothetical protein B5S33_g4862 [[Candida] boidinii]|nr:hypothetical protein B5S30_g5177 [[Candida] boidinii]OWB86180.1 hypothetical protein B5S33_g4862 [[Candida] boidinii]
MPRCRNTAGYAARRTRIESAEQPQRNRENEEREDQGVSFAIAICNLPFAISIPAFPLPFKFKFKSNFDSNLLPQQWRTMIAQSWTIR